MKKCSSGQTRNRSTGRCRNSIRRKSVKPSRKQVKSIRHKSRVKSINRSRESCIKSKKPSRKPSRKPCSRRSITRPGQSEDDERMSLGQRKSVDVERMRLGQLKSVDVERCEKCNSKNCRTIVDVETLPDDDELRYLFSKFKIKPMFDLHLEMMKFSKIR